MERRCQGEGGSEAQNVTDTMEEAPILKALDREIAFAISQVEPLLASQRLAEGSLAEDASGVGHPRIAEPVAPFEVMGETVAAINPGLNHESGNNEGASATSSTEVFSNEVEPSNREEWLYFLTTCDSLVSLGCALAWGLKRGFLTLTVASAEPAQAAHKGGLFPLPVELPGEVFLSPQQEDATQRWMYSSRCWLAVCCAAINSFYGMPGQGLTRARGKIHEAALTEMLGRIERFLKPVAPSPFSFREVAEDLKSKRVSYTGEEVSQPLPLTVEQISKSLPPMGHGASVPILPFLQGRTKFLMENPGECLKPAGDRGTVPTKARVHIQRGEEMAVFKLLEERRVIRWIPVTECYSDERGELTSGMFGVIKPGKFTPSGKPVLRVIMNLIPVNDAFGIVAGDIRSLPNATMWLPLCISDGEPVYMSQGDMASAFYLFAMPEAWHKYMSFNFKTLGSQIGKEPSMWFRPACIALPMGWSSSVGIMQAISRQVLLKQGLPADLELRKTKGLPTWFTSSVEGATSDRAWWQVYLDNFMSAQVGGSESQRDQALQSLAMVAWKSAGILTAEDKQVLGSTVATELGVRLDGETGLLGASAERIHKTCLASLHLLTKPTWSRKEAQVVLGRWIFILQYRRAAMGLLSRSWEATETAWPTGGKRQILLREVMRLMCLCPLLQSDLKAPYDPITTCSDASETGGAAAASKGLTWSGRSLTKSLLDATLKPLPADILLVSLFNGIGGCFRIYDVLGLEVAGRISIECLKEANRVTRCTWPGVEEILDVKLVTRALILAWANCYAHVKEVHIWSGFPCVHLSSVRAFRRNLSGAGSDLFWVMLEIIQLFQEVFGQFCKVKFCVENVSSMDASAREEISNHLQVQPIKLDPSDVLPYNRPRLAWCSEALYEMEGLTLHQENDYIRAWVSCPGVATKQWIRPGWHWPAEGQCTFPTFMKSIRRTQPPPVPAGIKRTSEATQELWRANAFRFPPYQFSPQYLVSCPGKPDRVLDCTERELLLGFGAGHTATCRSASDIKKSQVSYFDMRDTLCGDSFAIPSFAIMGAAMCADLFPRMSPAKIIARMGLAPGASAHPNVDVPLTRWLAYAGDGAPPADQGALVRCLGLTTNHTGSDVQLQSGQLLGKRSAHASVKALWWQWKQLFTVHWSFNSHINFLEMKMILLTLLWRARSVSSVRKRWLHLEDSMVCLYILTKGRTSSRLLQPLCNQIGAVQLALSATLLHAHVGSMDNPTDAGSRS